MFLVMKKLFGIFLCLAILLLSPAFAQQNISTKIDRYIKREMRQQQIPGVSLAVLRKGKIAILKSYGLSNIEHGVPVKPETVFQSGSIGKQFTAAAVMILVEEGKLLLDDKINKYISDAPKTWDNITIRRLLTHTAGMGDYPRELDLQRNYTEDQLLEIIKSTPLGYEPGTSWDYSNLGYVTLGILIRKITGKFYGDFLRERIFTPLGMTTARVISEADIVPNRASGYRLVSGKLKNQEWVSPSTNSTADGSLYFTVLDLAKWDAGLYKQSPLKQISLAEAWTPVRLKDGTTRPYGFGWHTDEVHGRRVVYHGGAWQGFKSFILRFPKDELTIIFFANSWETQDLKLARGLAAIFYAEFALPSVEPIEDKEPQVTRTLRRILNQLARGTADENDFTPQAQAAIFPQQAKEFAEILNSLSLPIANIYTNELIEKRMEGDLRVYRYVITDMGKSLFCTAKLTSDNKIAALEIAAQ